MARPINANAEETKRRILSAGSQLFADHGFEGASVRQIAAEAGVSVGMIRHYFGSKEGLYRACVESAYTVYEALRGEIRSEVARGGSPAAVLAAATRAGFQFALANRAAFKLTQWTLMESGSWRTELGDAYMLPFIADVARTLSAATSHPKGDTALRVRSLIFLVARYATADLDEMAILIAGGDMSAKGDASTLEKVEDHLAEVATRLFA